MYLDSLSDAHDMLDTGHLHYGSDYDGNGAARLTLSQFNTEADDNLYPPSLPMVLETFANQLGDNWPSGPLHLVEVNGDNDNTGQIEFFDSASVLATGSNNQPNGPIVYGFHYQYKNTLNNNNGLVDSVW